MTNRAIIQIELSVAHCSEKEGRRNGREKNNRQIVQFIGIGPHFLSILVVDQRSSRSFVCSGGISPSVNEIA